MTSDRALEDRIRRTYAAVATTTTIAERDDAPTIGDADAHRRPSRHWSVLVAAAAATCLVVGGVVVLVGSRGGTSEPAPAHTQPAPSTASQMPSSSRDALRAALRLWADFPVSASPRPLVLTSGTVLGPASGFTTNEAKEAFASGAFTEPTPFPTGPDRAAGYPVVTARTAFESMRADGSPVLGAPSPPTPLVVTAIQFRSASFDTDRGDRDLPAWLFSFRGVRDPAAVLAVAPSEQFPVPPGAEHVGNLGARVGPDGRTVTITFGGAPTTGPCSADYTVDQLTSDTAVAVILRSTRAPTPGVICPLVGHLREASITLPSPLGDRVLVQAPSGAPVVVDR